MPSPHTPPEPPRLPDALAPQAIAWWPFAALTPQQQAERRLLELAMRGGKLCPLPSVFGALS